MRPLFPCPVQGQTRWNPVVRTPTGTHCVRPSTIRHTPARRVRNTPPPRDPFLCLEWTRLTYKQRPVLAKTTNHGTPRDLYSLLVYLRINGHVSFLLRYSSKFNGTVPTDRLLTACEADIWPAYSNKRTWIGPCNGTAHSIWLGANIMHWPIPYIAHARTSTSPPLTRIDSPRMVAPIVVLATQVDVDIVSN